MSDYGHIRYRIAAYLQFWLRCREKRRQTNLRPPGFRIEAPFISRQYTLTARPFLPTAFG